MRFSYHLPVNLWFGPGEIARIGEQTAPWGKRALIVSGKSAARTGLLERVQAAMDRCGVSSAVFDRVTPNPLTTTVTEGASAAQSEQCDVVVGLGGGSMLDAAKAIAFLAGNGGDINDYIFGKQPPAQALPLILAPTTCGTGSEANHFAVLTNPDTKDKKSIRSVQMIAKASIIDPELMTTMPLSVLAAVGLDAFCHSMEAYLSRNAQPLTDCMAVEGMRLAADSLPALCQGVGGPADWEKLTWASTLGGMVIHTAGVAAAHAMEHPVSGLSGAVHGLGLAALIPSILEATFAAGESPRMAAVSRLLGGADASDCAHAFRRFCAKLGIHAALPDFGIGEKDLDWLTENCLKVSAASLAAHPVTFSARQIRGIYQAALAAAKQ